MKACARVGTANELDNARHCPQRGPKALRPFDAHVQLGPSQGMCAEVEAPRRIDSAHACRGPADPLSLSERLSATVNVASVISDVSVLFLSSIVALSGRCGYLPLRLPVYHRSLSDSSHALAPTPGVSIREHQ